MSKSQPSEYVNIGISIKRTHRGYMKENYISPSRYMQAKLDEDMKKV